MHCDWTPKRKPWKRRCTTRSARARSPLISPRRAGRLRRALLQTRCWLRFSGTFQACAQVRNEVDVILDAHRDSQQRIAYSRPQPGRFFHARMRHACRMSDEAFDPAQGFGQREALQACEERTDGRLTAGEFETQYRSKAALLPAGDFVARIALEPRIVDALHLGMARQELNHVR